MGRLKEQLLGQRAWIWTGRHGPPAWDARGKVAHKVDTLGLCPSGFSRVTCGACSEPRQPQPGGVGRFSAH